jgi:hypothetical protein
MQAVSWIADSLGFGNYFSTQLSHQDEQLQKIQSILERVDVSSVNEAMDAILMERDCDCSKAMADALREKVSPTVRDRINGLLYFMIVTPYGMELNRHEDIGYIDSDRELGHMMELLVTLATEEENISDEINHLRCLLSELQEHTPQNELIQVQTDLTNRISVLEETQSNIEEFNKNLNAVLSGYFGHVQDIPSFDSDISDDNLLDVRESLRGLAPTKFTRFQEQQNVFRDLLDNMNTKAENLHGISTNFMEQATDPQLRSALKVLTDYYQLQTKIEYTPPTSTEEGEDKSMKFTRDYESLVESIKGFSFSEYFIARQLEDPFFIGKIQKTPQLSTEKLITEDEMDEAYDAYGKYTIILHPPTKKTSTSHRLNPQKEDLTLEWIKFCDGDWDISQEIPSYILEEVSRETGIAASSIIWSDVIEFSRDKVYEFAGSVGSLIMAFYDWKSDREEPSCEPDEIADTWKDLKEKYPEKAKPFLYYLTRWGMWKDSDSIAEDLQEIGKGHIRGDDFYDQWLNGFVLFSTMAKALYVLKDRPESISIVTKIISEVTEDRSFTDEEKGRLESLQGFMQKELLEHSEDLANFIKLGLDTDEHAVSTIMSTVLKDGHQSKAFMMGLSNIFENLQDDPTKMAKFDHLVEQTLKGVKANEDAVKTILERTSEAIEQDKTTREIVTEGSRAVIDMMNTHPKATNFLFDLMLNNPELAAKASKVGTKIDPQSAEVMAKALLRNGAHTKKTVDAIASYGDFLEEHPKEGKKLEQSLQNMSTIMETHDEGMAKLIDNCAAVIEEDPKRKEALHELSDKALEAMEENPEKANKMVKTSLKLASMYHNFLKRPPIIPEYASEPSFDEPEFAAYHALHDAKKGAPADIMANDFRSALDMYNWVNSKREQLPQPPNFPELSDRVKESIRDIFPPPIFLFYGPVLNTPQQLT